MATTDELPDLESEARRLTEHLGRLKTVNAGLGAAAERVESAGAALDAAHDTLRATESRIASLNDGMSTALAALDRLEPDALRATIDSGFGSLGAAVELVRQELATESDRSQRLFAEHDVAQADRDQAMTEALADAAYHVFDAVEQTQRRIEASQAAVQQGLAELRNQQATLAETLSMLRLGQEALAAQTHASAVVLEDVKPIIDLTRQTATGIDATVRERLPALAADVQALRLQLANEANAVRRRQYFLFVATILLVAFLTGLAFRFFGAP